MGSKANKRKNNLSTLVAWIMAMAFLLTACSTGEKTNTSTNENSERTEKNEQVVTETVEQEEPKAEETATPEPTPEPTPAPTPDTESTLPGVEWMQSFNGIIEEPKLVVFNDENNKKIIIKDSNQEVEFYDDDTLAIYIPDNNGKVIRELKFEDSECYDSVVIFKNISSSIMRDGYVSATIVDIEFDGKPMTLYCYLKLMGNP